MSLFRKGRCLILIANMQFVARNKFTYTEGVVGLDCSAFEMHSRMLAFICGNSYRTTVSIISSNQMSHVSYYHEYLFVIRSMLSYCPGYCNYLIILVIVVYGHRTCSAFSILTLVRARSSTEEKGCIGI